MHGTLPGRTFLVATLLAAACADAPRPGAQAEAPSIAASRDDSRNRMRAFAASSAPSSRHAFETVVREGMGYADFRARILDLGWKPLPDAQCIANVIGDPGQCEGNSDLALCPACDEVPELGSYSSDGRSLSRFRHMDGAQVSVYARGELRYWAMRGDDPGLAVTGWSFEDPPSRRR